MTEVRVRHATPSDIEPAIEVWRAASTARHGGQPIPVEREAKVWSSARQPDAFLLVADDAGQVVGMGLAMQGLADDGMGPPLPGLCFISLIYIAPDRWGQGLGGRILDAVLTEARARGYGRAQLWTRTDNARAQRLYEHQDFRRSGREKEDDQGKLIVQYERAL